MNVIELLKADHETVSGLFRSFEAAKESEAEKTKIVERICQELEAHAAVEEELFYPAVERRAREDEKAQSSVLEAHQEHALVKTLVAELQEGPSGGNGRLDAKVKVLRDLVDHHVEEEEGQLMPRAKKLLSSEELDDLGAKVESRKQELRAEPRSREAGVRSGRAPSPRSSRRSSAPSGRGATSSASSRRAKASGSARPARRRSDRRRRRSR